MVETSFVQRLRRASFEDHRLIPTKSNYELRRCKSEVAQPTDSSADDNKTETANNPTAIAQNALTSKDKIQANFSTFFKIFKHLIAKEFCVHMKWNIVEN